MIVLLLACTTPPLLGSLADKLANEAVETAEPGIRLQIAVSSIISESCAASEPKTHVFSGPGAAALGIYGAPDFLKDDTTGKLYWTFEPAGLDGEQGKLVFETDSTRQNFTVTYFGGNIVYEGDMQLLYCGDAYHTARADESSAARAIHTGVVETGAVDTGVTTDTGDTGPSGTDLEAIVSGSSSFTDQETDLSSSINSLGSEPYAGLAFVPVTARLPIGGYPRWVSEDEATKITLDDASILPAGATGWPGTAKSTHWETTILVGLP